MFMDYIYVWQLQKDNNLSAFKVDNHSTVLGVTVLSRKIEKIDATRRQFRLMTLRRWLIPGLGELEYKESKVPLLEKSCFQMNIYKYCFVNSTLVLELHEEYFI